MIKERTWDFKPNIITYASSRWVIVGPYFDKALALEKVLLVSGDKREKVKEEDEEASYRHHVFMFTHGDTHGESSLVKSTSCFFHPFLGEGIPYCLSPFPSL